MKLHRKLYTGKEIEGESARIIEQLLSGETPDGIWVVLPAANGRDLFDIRPAADLKKTYFQNREALVLGIAASREDAVGIIQSIVQDCLRETGKMDIRSYMAGQA